MFTVLTRKITKNNVIVIIKIMSTLNLQARKETQITVLKYQDESKKKKNKEAKKQSQTNKAIKRSKKKEKKKREGFKKVHKEITGSAVVGNCGNI